MSDDKENNGEMLHCSFCGKSQAEVKKLVAGRGVYICDECIEVCINIVANWKKNARQKPEFHRKNCRPRPKLKNFLISMLSVRMRRKKFCRWRFITIINV